MLHTAQWRICKRECHLKLPRHLSSIRSEVASCGTCSKSSSSKRPRILHVESGGPILAEQGEISKKSSHPRKESVWKAIQLSNLYEICLHHNGWIRLQSWTLNPSKIPLVAFPTIRGSWCLGLPVIKWNAGSWYKMPWWVDDIQLPVKSSKGSNSLPRALEICWSYQKKCMVALWFIACCVRSTRRWMILWHLIQPLGVSDIIDYFPWLRSCTSLLISHCKRRELHFTCNSQTGV